MGPTVATRLDAAWLGDVLARDHPAALNVVGLVTPGCLELVVDGAVTATLDVDPDAAEAAGVSVATAVLERQAAGDCDGWELRLWLRDDGEDDLLVQEWLVAR